MHMASRGFAQRGHAELRQGRLHRCNLPGNVQRACIGGIDQSFRAFEPTLADGPNGKRVTARGAVDDKGQVSMWLTAFRAWHAETGTILFWGAANVIHEFLGSAQTVFTDLGGGYTYHTSRSQYIMSQALPMLREEFLAAQSGKIQNVSGATYTSQAFTQSLQSALLQAHA